MYIKIFITIILTLLIILALIFNILLPSLEYLNSNYSFCTLIKILNLHTLQDFQNHTKNSIIELFIKSNIFITFIIHIYYIINRKKIKYIYIFITLVLFIISSLFISTYNYNTLIDKYQNCKQERFSI